MACAGSAFSRMPRTSDRPICSPGKSRSATKLARLGPGRLSSCSGVVTFFAVYRPISYTGITVR